MAAVLAAFYNEWESRIGAAWPEVLPANGGGGIWPVQAIRRVALDKAFLDQHPLPFAVLDIPLYRRRRWALNNKTWGTMITAWYVRGHPEDVPGLTARLEALRDFLDANPLTTGQIQPEDETDEINLDDKNEINSRLVSRQQPALAGFLSFTCMTGEWP